MALKKLFFGGGPGDPVYPDWTKDKTKVSAYQDWYNAKYPKNAINFGLNNVNKGIWGPQSIKSWGVAGKDYTDYITPTKLDMSVIKPPVTTLPAVPGLVPVTPGALATPVANPTHNELVPGANSSGRHHITPKVDTPQTSWQDKAKALTPYVSNLVNSLRRAPKAPDPHLDPLVTLQRVNMSNDRAEVGREVYSTNKAANMNLDENSAAAVKQYTLADSFNKNSKINETERNANTEISNREVQTNAGITSMNNNKLDQQSRDNVERRVANQEFGAANLANAADKYQAIQNEGAKAALESKKLDVVKAMYDGDGVASRTFKKLQDIMTDPGGIEFIAAGKKNGMTDKQMIDMWRSDKRKKAASAKEIIAMSHKYGGDLKYSTGRMMKLFNN